MDGGIAWNTRTCNNEVIEKRMRLVGYEPHSAAFGELILILIFSYLLVINEKLVVIPLDYNLQTKNLVIFNSSRDIFYDMCICVIFKPYCELTSGCISSYPVPEHDLEGYFSLASDSGHTNPIALAGVLKMTWIFVAEFPLFLGFHLQENVKSQDF